MRHLALLCCAVALVGCSTSGERAADSSAGAPSTAAAPATISPGDVAGTWALRSTDAAGGTPTQSELTATADTAWTWKLANGSTVKVRVVAVGGDSIVTEAGPYESVLRPGIQTRNRTVYRLRDGKLIGTIEAHYALPRGDSAAQRRSEGTRVP
jgi:hypothetical protein